MNEPPLKQRAYCHAQAHSTHVVLIAAPARARVLAALSSCYNVTVQATLNAKVYNSKPHECLRSCTLPSVCTSYERGLQFRLVLFGKDNLSLRMLDLRCITLAQPAIIQFLRYITVLDSDYITKLTLLLRLLLRSLNIETNHIPYNYPFILYILSTKNHHLYRLCPVQSEPSRDNKKATLCR